MFAVAGTAIAIACGTLHGSLTGRNGAVTLFEHVLERPYWGLINLGSVAGFLCWLVAFAVLARPARPSPTAELVGRLAVAGLTLGIAVASLQFVIDGFTLPTLADQWVTAAPRERAEIVEMGDLVHTLVREPVFASEPILLFGLPFALVGTAVALGRRLPAWIGWAGAALGGSVLVMGVTWFVEFDLIPELLLWALLQPLEWAWMVAAGVLLWRRAGRAA